MNSDTGLMEFLLILILISNISQCMDLENMHGHYHKHFPETEQSE